MKQLIIGLGTGRCGSNSFQTLLSKQPDCTCFHEHRPRPDWENDEKTVLEKIKYLMTLWQTNVGDVGMYYLSYVDFILEKYPECKFVCLKRDKEATIKSFMKKTQGRNHWMPHNGKWKKCPNWDQCFPKYNVESKLDALAAYWDDYYTRSEEFVEKYPRNFKIFNVEDLNNEDQVERILNFCHIKRKNIVTNLRMNKS